MSVKYEFHDVVELPPRTSKKKGSKYSPIINGFLESGKDKVRVDIVSDRDSNYLRTQLKKRIDVEKLDKKVEVSVISGDIYFIRLEK